MRSCARSATTSRARRSTEAPGRVRIEFTRSRRIHFARFGILTDPDRGPGRERLLYSATYDGDLDSHLAELISITSDLDAIWGRCEAYSGAAGFADVHQSPRARARRPSTSRFATRPSSAHPGCDCPSATGGGGRRFHDGRSADVHPVAPLVAIRRRRRCAPRARERRTRHRRRRPRAWFVRCRS